LVYHDAFNQIRALPTVTTAAQEADLSKLLMTVRFALCKAPRLN
jgi:hypothetical protein